MMNIDYNHKELRNVVEGREFFKNFNDIKNCVKTSTDMLALSSSSDGSKDGSEFK